MFGRAFSRYEMIAKKIPMALLLALSIVACKADAQMDDPTDTGTHELASASLSYAAAPTIYVEGGDRASQIVFLEPPPPIDPESVMPDEELEEPTIEDEIRSRQDILRGAVDDWVKRRIGEQTAAHEASTSFDIPADLDMTGDDFRSTLYGLLDVDEPDWDKWPLLYPYEIVMIIVDYERGNPSETEEELIARVGTMNALVAKVLDWYVYINAAKVVTRGGVEMLEQANRLSPLVRDAVICQLRMILMRHHRTCADPYDLIN